MKVTVDYIFSKNNKIGSRFISWGTDHLCEVEETPSHIALLVDERWVFESTLSTGIRVIPYFKWLNLNKEVAKVPCKNRIREYSEIKSVYKIIQNKEYDWPGILYFGFYIFMNRYLSTKIPVDNKWENPDKYFCSEAVGMITGQGRYSMKAPVQLLKGFADGEI